jgi:hypothetical protein
MNETTRQKLIDMLSDYTESSFDLSDHINYGSSFKGLYNMTDQELVEEYEMYADDDDELLAESRAALAIDKMLE